MQAVFSLCFPPLKLGPNGQRLYGGFTPATSPDVRVSIPPDCPEELMIAWARSVAPPGRRLAYIVDENEKGKVIWNAASDSNEPAGDEETHLLIHYVVGIILGFFALLTGAAFLSQTGFPNLLSASLGAVTLLLSVLVWVAFFRTERGQRHNKEPEDGQYLWLGTQRSN